MSCSIAVFCLSNLYVGGEFTANPGYHMSYNEGSWCTSHACRGPISELRIGMKWEVSEGLVLDYGLKHQSFIAEKQDRGFEAAFVSFTWRPFK